MRELLVAIAGLALFTACDPTKKQDFSCSGASVSAFPTEVCAQIRVTDAEGAVAETQCHDSFDGSWASDPCSKTDAIGYCSIPGNDWFVSDTDVKVFVYSPADGSVAQAACENDEGGTWTWLII